MRALGIVTLAALAGASCGNDDNSGSGVSSNTRVSDLTTEEATRLCNSNKATFDAIAIGSCRLATAALSPTECAGCDSTQSVDCSGTDTNQVANCELTVGEMESCFKQFAAIMEGVTCENPRPSGEVPACFANVQAKCAGLFGGEESGDGGL